MNRFQHTATTAFNAKRLPPGQPTCALEHRCYPKHGITPDQILRLSRMHDVQDAFVYRHAAADSEDEHAHYKCPEIQLMPVSKRMVPIRRLAALVDTKHGITPDQILRLSRMHDVQDAFVNRHA